MRYGLHPLKMHHRDGELKPGHETIHRHCHVNLIAACSCEKREPTEKVVGERLVGKVGVELDVARKPFSFLDDGACIS